MIDARPLALATATIGALLALPPQFAIARDLDDFRQAADEFRQTQAQRTPPEIPAFELDRDATGLIATFQPGGAAETENNPFFQSLGTNGRTCFTCHQPQTGWTISAASVQARFAANSNDPLFQPVDGATCATADVSSMANEREAYSLLLQKALIRIALPMPSPSVLQFKIVSVEDPYDCNMNPAVGLTSPTTGTVSVYRRPLPTTNLGFLSTIMWDGREPSLAQQSADATLGHAQARTAPTAEQQNQIVAFESGVFTAQLFDNRAGFLDRLGARGGPVELSRDVSDFFVGINDPLGQNPTGAAFDSRIFDLYTGWTEFFSQSTNASIARGEIVFNTTPIDITGVAGLNDVLDQPNISGFCGTCHDAPNAGDHSVKLPLDIGVGDAGAKSPPGLDISGLPVFTLQCTAGPLAGQVFVVTDPGRALISGKCSDIGRLKGPILRGLASRPPYFHNGSAATLADVVNFYDRRFNIGFTAQQKADLVNFLNAL